jgi:glycosyltransferase involved in cell wall biosynthesis
MRFHIFGLPHTKTNQDYTACAYTAKVLKFAKMMTQRGHTVIHYGHPDSQVECTEHVDVISRYTYDQVYGAHDFHSKFFTYDINDAAYQEFYHNAIREVGARKQTHDFLLPFWGYGHKPICDAHPELITVEPGAGYASGYFAPWKVFESYALYHAYYGLEAVGNVKQNNYDVVIPNYFDHLDFDYSQDKSDYALFLGRIYNGKGINIAIQATERAGMRLVVAGQGGVEYFRDNYNGIIPAHVALVGYADRDMRRLLMSQAKCAIIASQYLEPFGGVMVENLFSGTPIITSDWGAMAENNIHGVTGYRCRTMEQYVWALNNIDRIKPEVCRDYAMNNFALEAIAPKYEEFFQQVLDVYNGSGWYQFNNITSINLPARYIPSNNQQIDYDLINDEELPQAQSIAAWIKKQNYTKVLDVGCGPGTYIDAYLQQGLTAQGIEPDSRTQHANIAPGSLLDPLAYTAPAVVCLEVLEHIDPTHGQLALTNLVNACEDMLIFSAARPGQGGTGHINCRPRADWIKDITDLGMTYSEQLTADLKAQVQQDVCMGWFLNNVAVFTK